MLKASHGGARRAGFHGDIDGATGKPYQCVCEQRRASVLIATRTAAIGSRGGWR